MDAVLKVGTWVTGEAFQGKGEWAVGRMGEGAVFAQPVRFPAFVSFTARSPMFTLVFQV